MWSWTELPAFMLHKLHIQIHVLCTTLLFEQHILFLRRIMACDGVCLPSDLALLRRLCPCLQKERRPVLRKLYKHLRNTQISKILGEEWKCLEPSKRRAFIEDSARRRAHFMQEHPDYTYTRGPSKRRKKQPEGIQQLSSSIMSLQSNALADSQSHSVTTLQSAGPFSNYGIPMMPVPGDSTGNPQRFYSIVFDQPVNPMPLPPLAQQAILVAAQQLMHQWQQMGYSPNDLGPIPTNPNAASSLPAWSQVPPAPSPPIIALGSNAQQTSASSSPMSVPMKGTGPRVEFTRNDAGMSPSPPIGSPLQQMPMPDRPAFAPLYLGNSMMTPNPPYHQHQHQHQHQHLQQHHQQHHPHHPGQGQYSLPLPHQSMQQVPSHQMPLAGHGQSSGPFMMQSQSGHYGMMYPPPDPMPMQPVRNPTHSSSAVPSFRQLQSFPRASFGPPPPPPPPSMIRPLPNQS
mmetsp:Transcript_1359/g.2383  ORF Transcript_1359/g.2383 Transcript_1359/m.2383 type:complete len:457 (-) Transcript_1359:697-2067(-)